MKESSTAGHCSQLKSIAYLQSSNYSMKEMFLAAHWSTRSLKVVLFYPVSFQEGIFGRIFAISWEN